MRHYLLFIVPVFLLVYGCNQTSNSADKSVYIGGQIVNPNTDYFIISKDDAAIDTLYLDQNGQFGKKINNIEEGIYSFKHSPENQVMYVEPGDSLLVWLNTLAFDESINFSGKGSQKSSFLLDLFLLNEKNNELILSYYKIKPEKFASITDSIRQSRIEKLESLKKENDFSNDFLETAEASINYEYYDLRERYTFLIKKYYKEFAAKIPEGFHDYRENLDFNNEKLQSYYVYLNFIDDYLRTKSLEYCENNNIRSGKCYDLNDFDNIKRRILLIDSLSQTPGIKNEFLNKLASKSITLANTDKRIDSILNLTSEINYPDLQNLKELAQIQKAYLAGKSVAELDLLTTEGKIIEYKKLLNKPVITYTWSIYSPTHHNWQHNIIKDLRKKYPEINFVGLNIDQGETEDWKKVVEKKNYNKNFEFQIINRDMDKSTLRKYLSKMLFINKKGVIVRGDAQLNPVTFENEILEFLNK
ncbi:TlpA family protein disulfide reductase [Salegentibacter chungangensis]|uniref:TlpA family protein disulfide reductase n=1 Tax=Salegentibacter chungangensis TaxID=1335724 RepID=A0ABW3NRX3_9FLAO